MKKKLCVLFLAITQFHSLALANKTVPLNVHRPSFSVADKTPNLNNLEYLFKTDWKKGIDFANLSKRSLSFGPKAVPVLLNVMKKKSYPVKNRWIAMFSVTKLMGKKSAKVLSKFTKHPDWMMRLGALKCLLFLKEKQFAREYSHLLKDKSQIVRQQALMNIQQLEIKESAPAVSSLLKDITSQSNAGNNLEQMTDMTIMTLTKFGHKDSIKTMLEMMKNSQFKNNSATIDYSLEKLTGVKSPKGDWNTKLSFWHKYSSSKT